KGQAADDKDMDDKAREAVKKALEAPLQPAIKQALDAQVKQALDTQIKPAIKEALDAQKSAIEKSLEAKIQSSTEELKALLARWGPPVTPHGATPSPPPEKGADAQLTQIIEHLDKMDGRLKNLEAI